MYIYIWNALRGRRGGRPHVSRRAFNICIYIYIYGMLSAEGGGGDPMSPGGLDVYILYVIKYVYVCICIYMCLCIYIYIYIYTYIFMSMYIYVWNAPPGRRGGRPHVSR